VAGNGIGAGWEYYIMNTFGIKSNNIKYTERSGSYGIIIKDGNVRLVKVDDDYFLPGGGLENGEDHEQGLKRELIEEIGVTVKKYQLIDKVEEYLTSKDGREHYLMTSAFYLIEDYAMNKDPIEKDHKLVWIDIKKAKEILLRDSHKWVLNESLK
jgi:8-oxo-dGTP diphosphatase